MLLIIDLWEKKIILGYEAYGYSHLGRAVDRRSGKVKENFHINLHKEYSHLNKSLPTADEC